MSRLARASAASIHKVYISTYPYILWHVLGTTQIFWFGVILEMTNLGDMLYLQT